MNLSTHLDFEAGIKSLEKLKTNFPDSFLKIAVVGKSNYFIPYREALVEAIKKSGFEARGFDQIEYDYDPDVFLIINPFHFQEEKFKYEKYIYAGIQTEQIQNNEVYCVEMGLSRYKTLLKNIKKYDLLFEWSPATYRFLKNKFDNIYFFPHSNFNTLQFYNKYNDIEEQYDLFFAGWSTGVHNRRAKLLDALSERYNVYPKFENLWDEEKEKAIMSSKICLNLHFDNSLVYESPRMYEYIANKKFVLTEKISDSYPFIEGENYDSFYIHNMFEKIDFYLSHPIKRNQIATSGFNKINNFTLDKNINVILERFLLEKWSRKSRRQHLRNIIFHKVGFPVKKFR